MRPEIDNFSKVSVNGWTGAMPTSFIVKTKAGQELRYGGTADARSPNSSSNPPIAWFVNQIQDATKNTIGRRGDLTLRLLSLR